MITLIVIILIIAVVGFVILAKVAAFLLVAFLISLAVYISSKGKYKEALQKEPSRMVCKNCGSKNIRIQNRVEGWSAGGSGASGGAVFGGHVSNRIDRQHIAVCADCGFDSPYVTIEEIEAERKKAKSTSLSALVFTILFALIMIFGASAIFSDKEEPADSSTEIVEQETSEKTTTSESEKDAVTGVEVTKETDPITDFMYEISGDTVKLDSANTRKHTLVIRPSYTIDGKEYKTDVSDFGLMSGSSGIETVIFPEGITEVKNSVFNCSDVKTIFFPKSLSIIYDYTLSYLHPDEGERISIYYAGTQEDWAKIFTEYKRTPVADAKTPEEVGTALADKLNEKLGWEYDSSLFDFYFSSTPEDVLNSK